MYETFIVLDSAQQVLAKMPAPPPTPLITGDAVSFGVLMGVLGLIFYTSSRKSGFWAKFYSHIPALLLCYFVPGLLSTFHIIGEESASHIYHIASRYLLPAALFLLTLSIDIQKIIGLGWKALAMFFAACWALPGRMRMTGRKYMTAEVRTSSKVAWLGFPGSETTMFCPP